MSGDEWLARELSGEALRAIADDLRALLAERDALVRDRERIDAFVVDALDESACADLMRSMLTAGRNGVPLATALAYWPPFEKLTIDAARITTTAREERAGEHNG